MRLFLSNPSVDAEFGFYVNALTADVESQINRLGPAEVIARSLGGDPSAWPSRINQLVWPRGADTFACCLLTLTDEQADQVESSVLAQASSWTEGDPRPYLVLSALLAPAEGASAAESYAPADIDPVAVETELVGWKLYPLAPVRLPEADVDDDYGGMWLLPLVDARYFWRLTPLNSGGSGSGSGSGSYHTVDDPPAAGNWMPDLRAWPDDTSPPANYVEIENNGTSRGIGPWTSRGVAADQQAAMENWRVVCRDVRSNYNAAPGATQHSSFTGVLSDYPDGPTEVSFLASFDVDDGGSGYEVGDTILVSGGTSTYSSRLRVTGVDDLGAVLAGTLTNEGAYSSPPAGTLNTTGGTGTGLTLTATFSTGDGPSYHKDAIRLAAYEGNLIAGGLADGRTARHLVPTKVHVLFPVTSDDAYWGVLVTKSVADPTATTDLAEDADGPTVGERDHVPKAVLGVESNGRAPATADRADLVTAAKQWTLLYHLWRRRQAYFKYPGIAPVIPNGYAERIVWNFAADDFSTIYVGHADATGTDDNLGDGGGPERVRFLRVTGGYDSAAQRYPAVLQRQEHLPAQWVDEEFGWLVGANDEELVVGHRYLARAGDKYQGEITWATFCCGTGNAGREDETGEDVTTLCCPAQPVPRRLLQTWTKITGPACPSLDLLDGHSVVIVYRPDLNTSGSAYWLDDDHYVQPTQFIDSGWFLACTGNGTEVNPYTWVAGYDVLAGQFPPALGAVCQFPAANTFLVSGSRLAADLCVGEGPIDWTFTVTITYTVSDFPGCCSTETTHVFQVRITE